MRAAQYARYGGPDVVHLAEAIVPSPRRGQVLIAVHGTSVNPVEASVREGALRIVTGATFPKGTGMDFAGEIAELGTGVTGFAVGDRVWGFTGGLPTGASGAAADYVVAKTTWISRAPESIDLVTAGGMPMVGETAILALRRHLRLVPGERLLVRGASGGVGSIAVQLGATLGARVVGLASASNLEFVASLGADEVHDYHTTPPAALGGFDAILDLVGKRMRDYHALLAPGGRMVTTAIDNPGFIVASLVFGPRRVRAFSALPRTRYFGELADLVDSGGIVPVVGGVHPLSDAAVAHRALAEGSRGKQIIAVKNPTEEPG